MTKDYVLPATVGMKFQQTHLYWTREKIDNPDPPVEVVASCGNEKAPGRWVCIEHGMLFENQFQKDTHIGASKYERPCHLAWLCFEHGKIEVP